MQKINAFFAEGSGISNELSCQIRIRPTITGGGNLEGVTARAIWDTGATHSSINSRLAGSLGLEPIDTIRVGTAGGPKDCDVYLIDLYLPNDVYVTDIPVAGLEDLEDDLLIGMDVIALGDFAISNFAGKTCYTFRVPSVRRIDFVEEIDKKDSSKKPVNKKDRNRRKKEKANKKQGRK